MLADNFVEVFLVNIGIPSTLGVDHKNWAFRAAVHAAGGVNSDLTFAVQAKRLNFVLGVIAHGLSIMIRTTGAAVLALIDTEKNMVSIEWLHDLRRRVSSCMVRTTSIT